MPNAISVIIGVAYASIIAATNKKITIRIKVKIISFRTYESKKASLTLLFLMALISNFVIKNAPVNANTLPPIYSKMKWGKIDTIEKYKSPPKGAPIATALNITRIKEI